MFTYCEPWPGNMKTTSDALVFSFFDDDASIFSAFNFDNSHSYVVSSYYKSAGN